VHEDLLGLHVLLVLCELPVIKSNLSYRVWKEGASVATCAMRWRAPHEHETTIKPN